MRDLSIPNLPSSSCIQLSERIRSYELDEVQFTMLPSFCGLPNEDPLYFMRDFYGVVSYFPLRGLDEDELKLRCFPYTLKDKAKVWFMTLHPNSLATWDDVYDKFMSRYYHPHKTTNLRRMITTFTQLDGEPFHEAWVRFKMLLLDCPHHHFSLDLLIQFFYDGLSLHAQELVDNVAGGTIGVKTALEVFDLFELLETTSRNRIGRVGRGLEVQQRIEVCDVCGNFGHNAINCSMSCDEFSVNQYEHYSSPQAQQVYAPLKYQSMHTSLPQGTPLENFMQDDFKKNDKRIEEIVDSTKKLEGQVEQVVKSSQVNQKGKFLCQTKNVESIMCLNDFDNEISYKDFDDLLSDIGDSFVEEEEFIEETLLNLEGEEEKEDVKEEEVKEEDKPPLPLPMDIMGHTLIVDFLKPLPLCMPLNSLCVYIVGAIISNGKGLRKLLYPWFHVKLEMRFKVGDVQKQGAKGDGVEFNIKVNPP